MQTAKLASATDRCRLVHSQQESGHPVTCRVTRQVLSMHLSIGVMQRVESEDEYEEDPDMALAMGFGGFAGGVHA